MAKRFSETKIWDDVWYQDLPIEWKLLWKYVCDKCDEAGIWKVNQSLAEFQLKTSIKWEEAENRLNLGKKRISFENGFWIINDFVSFQYGDKILNSEHPFHKKIRDMLDRVYGRVSNIGYNDTLQEKEKEKVMVKDKGVVKGKEGKEKYLDLVFLTKEEYQKLVELFGEVGVNERIARLNEYGYQKPKKFKEYGSHYHTILAWARKETPGNNLTPQQRNNLHGLKKLMKEIDNDEQSVSTGICGPDGCISGDTV